MKKKYLLFFLITMFFFSTFSFSQTITVDFPYSGNVWYKGKVHYIKWRKSGNMNANVKIRLYQGETKILRIVDSTPNDGLYEWRIPESVDRGTYHIRVKTVDNLVYDDGEEFTIEEASAIGHAFTITSPKAGEIILKAKKLTIKTKYTITWRDNGSHCDSVRIYLKKYGDDNFYEELTSFSRFTRNTGAFEWDIRHSDVGKFYIKIVSYCDREVYGKSGVFTMVEKSDFQLTKRKDKARDFAFPLPKKIIFKDGFLVVRIINYYRDFEGDLKFRILIHHYGYPTVRRDVVKHIRIKANEVKEISFRSNLSVCGKIVNIIIDPDNEIEEISKFNNEISRYLDCVAKR